MQNLGGGGVGQIRCIMGNVEMAYYASSAFFGK